MELSGPVWLMQPIPYWGEKLQGDWIYEPKIDGWRLQVIKYQDGRVELWGRRLERSPNWTAKLSYLIPAFKELPNGSLVDAELYSTGGRRFIPSLFARKRKVDPIIYVFDVIFWEGEFVGNHKLRERKALLETISWSPPVEVLRYDRIRNIREHWEAVIKSGGEGLVLKYLESTYEVGRDGPIATQYWRKVKRGLYIER